MINMMNQNNRLDIMNIPVETLNILSKIVETDLITYAYEISKTHNISIDNLSITRGYLIYGNIKLITDNTLKYLFNNQLNGIQKIMDYLSITELPKELDTLTMKKSYLKTKALDSEDESIKEQIPDLIDLIKLSSLEEIKDIFIENK